MKRLRNISLLISTLLLLVLWIPVSLDKVWDLEGFRQTLLRQPFPDSWANVLFWILPVLELVCALLLVMGTIGSSKSLRLRIWGFALSFLLMLGFTLFILFGVLGWYEKRPCGCGSVIAGLSWEQHLWFNVFFLLVSWWGWWLSHRVKTARSDGEGTPPLRLPMKPNDEQNHLLFLMLFARPVLGLLRTVQRMRYPRKFAVFTRCGGKAMQTSLLVNFGDVTPCISILRLVKAVQEKSAAIR